MKIFFTYIVVILLITSVNIIRILRCRHIIRKLIRNRYNSTPKKNCNYILSIKELLQKASIPAPSQLTTKGMAEKEIIQNIIDDLLQAAGVYRHRAIHSPLWPIYIIERACVFRPIQKIPNKVLSVILALLEGFALYLLGLFLDTTGIGDKILTFLLEPLTALFARLAAFFH